MTHLPVRPIKATDGWCEDPGDRRYNQPVRLAPDHPGDRLKRDDRLYDFIIEIDHNTRPRIAGRGSAVFVHVARPGFAPTAGCVALKTDALRRLIAASGRRLESSSAESPVLHDEWFVEPHRGRDLTETRWTLPIPATSDGPRFARPLPDGADMTTASASAVRNSARRTRNHRPRRRRQRRASHGRSRRRRAHRRHTRHGRKIPRHRQRRHRHRRHDHRDLRTARARPGPELPQHRADRHRRRDQGERLGQRRISSAASPNIRSSAIRRC